jgi:hypothetical protein
VYYSSCMLLGYLYVENALSPETVQRLTAAADRLYEESSAAGSGSASSQGGTLGLFRSVSPVTTSLCLRTVCPTSRPRTNLHSACYPATWQLLLWYASTGLPRRRHP